VSIKASLGMKLRWSMA